MLIFNFDDNGELYISNLCLLNPQRKNLCTHWIEKQILYIIMKKKAIASKIGPITGPRCPEGSRKLRFPDYMTLSQDGGKVVSLTHRPPLPPENTPGTHFC